MQQSVSSILRPSRPLRRAALGCFLPIARGRKRPILLKKSAMVYASEKYASEIENLYFLQGLPDSDFT